jgi:hypothetical protein
MGLGFNPNHSLGFNPNLGINPHPNGHCDITSLNAIVQHASIVVYRSRVFKNPIHRVRSSFRPVDYPLFDLYL